MRRRTGRPYPGQFCVTLSDGEDEAALPDSVLSSPFIGLHRFFACACTNMRFGAEHEPRPGGGRRRGRRGSWSDTTRTRDGERTQDRAEPLVPCVCWLCMFCSSESPRSNSRARVSGECTAAGAWRADSLDHDKVDGDANVRICQIISHERTSLTSLSLRCRTRHDGGEREIGA